MDTVEGAITVYLLSLVPSFEGRYAVATAAALGMPAPLAVAASLLGVATLSLVLPPLLPLLDDLARTISESRIPIISRLARAYLRYVARIRGRVRGYVERWGIPGLIAFVAVPLPGTGVWTGALAAYILGMRGARVAAALLAGGAASIAFVAVPAYITLGG